MTQIREDDNPFRWLGLDGLRAVAALLVLIEHVFQDLPIVKWITPGYFGVRMFFVLSGFLITRILLNCRTQETGIPLRRSLTVFYARRSLRIFPIYYLTLGLVFALSPWINGLQGYHWWRFLYLSNFHMAIHNTGDVYYGHLWTLAVEEQFYLVWPTVILLSPKRLVLPIVIAVAALGPLGRCVTATMDINDFWIRKPTWACFDSLGSGALLAIVRWQQLIVPAAARRGLLLISIIGVPSVLQCRWVLGEQSIISALMLGLIEAPLLVYAVAACSLSADGPLGRALSWKPLAEMGKRSYGFYLYHAFLMPFVALCLRTAQIDTKSPSGLALYFVLTLTFTLIAAWLSWRFVERPLNRLKNRIVL